MSNIIIIFYALVAFVIALLGIYIIVVTVYNQTRFLFLYSHDSIHVEHVLTNAEVLRLPHNYFNVYSLTNTENIPVNGLYNFGWLSS